MHPSGMSAKRIKGREGDDLKNVSVDRASTSRANSTPHSVNMGCVCWMDHSLTLHQPPCGARRRTNRGHSDFFLQVKTVHIQGVFRAQTNSYWEKICSKHLGPALLRRWLRPIKPQCMSLSIEIAVVSELTHEHSLLAAKLDLQAQCIPCKYTLCIVTKKDSLCDM